MALQFLYGILCRKQGYCNKRVSSAVVFTNILKQLTKIKFRCFFSGRKKLKKSLCFLDNYHDK